MATVPSIDAHLLCPSSSWLGECPLWRSETNEICWVDIHGKTFFRRRFTALAGSPSKTSPLKEKTRSYPLPEMPGSFCLCEDGRLIFAFKGGLAYYDPEEGPSSLQRIADFEPHLPTRMNDGRVDPMGRFVVGGYDAAGGEPGAAPRSAIYRLDPATMAVEKVLAGVGCSNSIAFTRDDPPRCAMFHTDSFARPRRIFRVDDYGSSGGAVHRDTPFTTWTAAEEEGRGDGLPASSSSCASSSSPGLPDGSVVDSAGHLWNCQFGCGRVVRYNRRSGKVDFVITVPVPHVTCLAFGGPDRRHVFITNASRKCLSAAEQAALPEGYAGGLFVARLPDDMPGGAEETRFGTAAAKEWARRSGGEAGGGGGGDQGSGPGANDGESGAKDALGSGLLVGAAAVALAAACLYYSVGGAR